MAPITTHIVLAWCCALAHLVQVLAQQYVIFGGTTSVVQTRLDPIVNPGTYGGHVHDVFGGSGFSENYDYNQLIQSQCTTMEVTKDFSNYWVPAMYYVDPNTGSYTLMKSTMNIYYLIRPGPNNDKIQPFPQGLRMVAGDNERGTYNSSDPTNQAVSYVCLDYNNNHQGDPDWAERPNFFDHQCPDGMRAQVFFPSCWDGKNLDSADHKSHMSYPIGAYNDGYCPDSHPVHLISLFYELFVPTNNYPYNGAGTWSFSNGDTVGYRYHGDFAMGWSDTGLLQQFIDNCPNAQGNVADCPAFAAVMDTAAASACQFDGMIVNEDIGDVSPIAKLPGCNPTWDGTGSMPTCGGTDNPGLVNAITPLPAGWSDLGCIAEGTSGRALPNLVFQGGNTTKAGCSALCANQGLPYAGVENGNQCFCGSALMNGAVTSTVPQEQCNGRCSGNSLETCGGPNKLQLLHNPNPVPVSLPLGSSGSPPPPPSPTSSTAPAASSAPTTGSTGGTQWVNTSCSKDGSSRALTGYSFASDQMTPSLCQSACASRGFSMAGLEYGAECYCGNSFQNNLGQTIDAGQCGMPCTGDASSKCGGAWALSVFTAAKPTSGRKRMQRRSRRSMFL